MERQLSISFIQRISSKYGTTYTLSIIYLILAKLELALVTYLFTPLICLFIYLLIKHVKFILVCGEVNLREVRVPAR